MDRARLLSLLVPTGVSLLVHLGLLALIAAVSITAIRLTRPDTPMGDVVVTLEAPAPSQASAPTARAPVDAMDAIAPPHRIVASTGATALAPPPVVLTPGVPVPLPSTAPSVTDLRRAATPSAAFAGLRATRVRRIVYVVDISGPMASSLAFVLDELRRSVARLQPTQQFQVILFHDDIESSSDLGTLWLGPRDQPARLLPASPANRAALAQFLDDVRPAGRSNPLAGLRAALALRPDAIFLLARGISRTGPSARWGEGTDAILAELDALNPAINGSTRRTVIKTIQFIDDDPTGLMQAIASAHGGGPHSYSRRNVADFEADQRPAPMDTLVDAPDPNVTSAALLLQELSASRADLRVLFDLPADTDAVRRTASRALDLVSRAGDPEPSDDFARLVLARALLVMASADHDDASRLLDRAIEALDTSEGAPQEVLATASLAHARRQSAGDPDLADSLARRAVTADPTTIAALEARLGAIRATADHAFVLAKWLDDLDHALTQAPLVVDGRLDGALALLALDAAASSRLRHASTPDGVSEALRLHLDWARNPRPGLPPLGVLKSAGSLIPADTPIDQIDPDLALARGLSLLPEPGVEPTVECLRALDVAALRAPPDSPTPETACIRAAMSVSLWADRTSDATPRGGAVARLDLALREHPGRAWRRDAALHILAHTEALIAGGSDPDDPALAAPRRRALHVVVIDDPRPDPNADAWRLELAHLTALADPGDATLETDALSLLEGPWTNRPNAQIDRLQAWILSTQVARLAARLSEAHHDARDTEARAIAAELIQTARLAIPPTSRTAAEAADALRADLAEALIVLESPEAAEIYADLRSRGVTLGRSPEAMTLSHARALIAAHDPASAFALLRSLTTSMAHPPGADDPRPDARDTYWHAWTLTVGILAARAHEDPLALRTATAHLLRLADLAPDLGGEPWASRLRAHALSIGLSLDPPDGAIHSPP